MGRGQESLRCGSHAFAAFDGLGVRMQRGMGRESMAPARTRQPSWIGDHFTRRTSEQHLQSVQYVSAEDTFATKEVRLQAARIFLSVEEDPDTKVKGWRRTARHASHPAWPALGGGELECLTVCPRERAGIRSSVSDDSIQAHSGRSTQRTEVKSEDR